MADDDMSKIEKLVEDSQSADGTQTEYSINIDGEMIRDIDTDTMNLEFNVYTGVDVDISLEGTPKRSIVTTVSNVLSGHHYDHPSSIKQKRPEGSDTDISGNISLAVAEVTVDRGLEGGLQGARRGGLDGLDGGVRAGVLLRNWSLTGWVE